MTQKECKFPSQKEYLIIYHREDNDGIFSAAIFEDYLLNSLHIKLEDLVFIGADYNMLNEFIKDKNNSPEQLHEDFKHIIMTDISFNDPKFMKKLYKEFGNDFIWVDHHAPIIQESHKQGFDNCPGVRDTQRSAILNAWKFLYDQFDEAYNQKKVPELLRILSGWDSWSYEREGYEADYVRNINKATTIKYDLSLSKAREVVHNLVSVYVNNEPSGNMSEVFKDGPLIEQLHDFGKQLNDYDDIINRGIIETAGDTSWELFIHDKDLDETKIRKCCVIFHQGATNSLIFKSLRNTDIKNGVVFKHNPNSTWTISLYNINDDDWFHCGEYCKEIYGGGGHKGAAGCQVTQEQFIKILKNKKI
jgi:oligoribonuclease NrnB/cAMP/cGMP phosphodiesterase (DHH superfamily)